MRYQGLLRHGKFSYCIWLIFRKRFGLYIPAIVDILRIASHGNAGGVVNARVNGIKTLIPERVDKNLEISKCLAVARLQRRAIAGGLDIKDGDGAEDGVGVYAGPPSIILEVLVGHKVLSIPV